MSTATGQLLASRDARLAARLSTLEPQLDRLGTVREGVLRRAVGLTLEAEGCEVPLGSAVRIEAQGGQFVEAEVVGFAGDKTFLMPTTDLHGLLPRARVVPGWARGRVAVGEEIGRAHV